VIHLDKKMLPFKAFYFFVYAAMAGVMPFLTLYYESLGLVGQQIGILAAIPPMVTFLSAPLFGFLADVTRRQKLLLTVSILSLILGVVGITVADSFWELGGVVLFYAFFFAPLIPLVDRSVLEVLGERRDQYGRQRVWGALGWGAAAPLAGWLVARGGLHWSFYASAVLFGLLAITTQGMSVSRLERSEPFWLGLKKIASRFRVLVFFVIVLGGGVGLALIHHYLFVFLSSLQASSFVMGWSLSVATVSELGVMYFSDRLLARWGARGVLGGALAALALRLFAMGMVSSPGWVLWLQLLHGPTFAALWVAGVAYVAEIAPPAVGNTAQGLFTGFVMGLGSAIGALAGGLLYQQIGFSRMYLWAALGIFLLLILFWVACRDEC
jgi:PPP family 3-phenylpropionic acid transporter